jgi:dTMP kinase
MKYHIEFDIDFKRNKEPGVYIALEGTEGTGKTTQQAQLRDYFTKQGKEVVTTREPRKNVGVVGKLVQDILLGKTKVPSIAFQYLFTADRAIHHEELILPALRAGKIVISDRCFWSAIPYGVMDRAGKFDPKSITSILMAQSILSMYHQFTVPDYTFYLDLPLETALKRMGQDGSPKEIYEDRKQVKATINGYNWLLKEFPKEFIVVDSQKSIDEVTAEIVNKIKKKK